MSAFIPHTVIISLVLSLGLGIAGTPESDNDQPAENAPVKRDLSQATALKVFPENVNITHGRDQQTLVVQAVMPDGVTVDVTHDVEWKLDNENAARMENHRLLPVGDGQANLNVSLGALTTGIPVSVTNATVKNPRQHNGVAVLADFLVPTILPLR